MSEEKYWDLFKRQVDRGRKGDNVWIPVALDRLKDHIGITKRIYTLLGGDPGTGKSAFVHLNYILHPYYVWKKAKENNQTEVDLNIILRSMERSKHYIIGKWVCWMLWQKHGLLMDVPTMYGWGTADNPIGDDIYGKIEKTKEWFYEMEEECLTIIDGADNPTGLYKHAKKIAEEHGRRYNPSRYEKAYDAHDEKALFIYIIDHIGCLTGERGYNRKQILDKMSEYLKEMRDLYGWKVVAVNQFNRSLSDSTRRTNMTMAPEKQDFKGSGNMYEDCDIAQALFNPYQYHIEENLDYQIADFVNEDGYNRFRSNYVLKNTYGISNFSLGMNFLGEIGHFRTLVPPDQIDPTLLRKYREGGRI